MTQTATKSEFIIQIEKTFGLNCEHSRVNEDNRDEWWVVSPSGVKLFVVSDNCESLRFATFGVARAFRSAQNV